MDTELNFKHEEELFEDTNTEKKKYAFPVKKYCGIVIAIMMLAIIIFCVNLLNHNSNYYPNTQIKTFTNITGIESIDSATIEEDGLVSDGYIYEYSDPEVVKQYLEELSRNFSISSEWDQDELYAVYAKDHTDETKVMMLIYPSTIVVVLPK